MAVYTTVSVHEGSALAVSVIGEGRRSFVTIKAGEDASIYLPGWGEDGAAAARTLAAQLVEVAERLEADCAARAAAASAPVEPSCCGGQKCDACTTYDAEPVGASPVAVVDPWGAI